MGWALELQQSANLVLVEIDEQLTRESERCDNAVAEAKLEEMNASAEVEKKEAEYRNFDSRHVWSPLRRALLTAVLLTLEIPINAIAFEIFRHSWAFTIAMAVGLTVALGLLAHAVGSILADPRRNGGEETAAAGMSALALCCVLGVAACRTLVVKTPHQYVLTAAFVVIQAVILVAAGYVTYRGFDPVAPYRRALARVQTRLFAAMVARSQVHELAVARARAAVEEAMLVHAAYEGANIKFRTDGLLKLPPIQLRIPYRLAANDPADGWPQPSISD